MSKTHSPQVLSRLIFAQPVTENQNSETGKSIAALVSEGLQFAKNENSLAGSHLHN